MSFGTRLLAAALCALAGAAPSRAELYTYTLDVSAGATEVAAPGASGTMRVFGTITTNALGALTPANFVDFHLTMQSPSYSDTVIAPATGGAFWTDANVFDVVGSAERLVFTVPGRDDSSPALSRIYFGVGTNDTASATLFLSGGSGYNPSLQFFHYRNMARDAGPLPLGSGGGGIALGAGGGSGGGGSSEGTVVFGAGGPPPLAQPVPAPAGLLLAGAGLPLLAVARRRAARA